MLVYKKIRFFIISPGYLRKICDEKRTEGLEYRIITDEHGIILNLFASEKEPIRSFLLSLPDELLFFHSHKIASSLVELVCEVVENSGKMVVTAESCTGGLVAKRITDRPGSSEIFWGSFITYNNNAKKLLGVSEEILEKYGAVSQETVISMAENGFEKSGAGVCVSVSGIAGPGGGTKEKPVGMVWVGIKKEKTKSFLFHFSGSREEIRDKAAQAALLVIYRELLNNEGVDSTIFEHYI